MIEFMGRWREMNVCQKSATTNLEQLRIVRRCIEMKRLSCTNAQFCDCPEMVFFCALGLLEVKKTEVSKTFHMELLKICLGNEIERARGAVACKRV